MKRPIEDSDTRYPWDLILGGSRHPYGISPEQETAWCRLFLIVGFFGGVLFILFLQDLFR